MPIEWRMPPRSAAGFMPWIPLGRPSPFYDGLSKQLINGSAVDRCYCSTSYHWPGLWLSRFFTAFGLSASKYFRHPPSLPGNAVDSLLRWLQEGNRTHARGFGAHQTADSVASLPAAAQLGGMPHR